jgi:hypothetical protein
LTKDLCSRVRELHDNIDSVVFVSNGSIAQWSAGPGVKMPGHRQMEGTAFQQLIMASVAEARQDLGKVHFSLVRYDDSDALLFSLPAKEASLLIVGVRRPYVLDSLAGKVMSIITSSDGIIG